MFNLTELAAVASGCTICPNKSNKFRNTVVTSSSLFLFRAPAPLLEHDCDFVEDLGLSAELARKKPLPHRDPVEVSFHREHPVVLSAWRLVRHSVVWSRRGHLQSQQVSKVPGRLWLLVVASFALQMLDSQFPVYLIRCKTRLGARTPCISCAAHPPLSRRVSCFLW